MEPSFLHNYTDSTQIQPMNHQLIAFWVLQIHRPRFQYYQTLYRFPHISWHLK
ncbi:hypothetical protein ACM6L3_19250 [Paenibacillus larvae]